MAARGGGGGGLGGRRWRDTRHRSGWAMEEREREPHSMEDREREREGGGKNRVPSFNWMPRREKFFSPFGCPRFLQGNPVAPIAKSLDLSKTEIAILPYFIGVLINLD